MICYHGSSCIVECPSTQYSRNALDFGKGFYVTTNEEQVRRWCRRFLEKGERAFISNYQIEINEIKKGFKVKEFKKYNNEWFDFILKCRKDLDVYKNYDMVIGGVADDKIYNTIELYESGLITKSIALKRFIYHKPNNQVCIINQKVIDKHLTYLGYEEVYLDGSR